MRKMDYVKAYEDVLILRRQGLGYKKIRKKILEIHGIKLSLSTISYWVRSIHSPLNGGMRRFPSIEFLKPCEELSYIIGVGFGDGTALRIKHKRGYEHRIALSANDKEFVEEFAKCIAVVLGREPPKSYYVQLRRRYYTKVNDRTLFELLHEHQLEKVKPFIEHCEKCKAKFLRGLFDSEGCISKTIEEKVVLKMYNTDHKLLLYVQQLLASLGIESTGPHLGTKKGTYFRCPKTGKVYRRRKDVYYLRIRTQSLLDFYRKVGFTIRRKQEKLKELLKGRGLLDGPPDF